MQNLQMYIKDKFVLTKLVYCFCAYFQYVLIFFHF